MEKPQNLNFNNSTSIIPQKRLYFAKYKQKKWNKEDDIKLINLVDSYNSSKIKWFEISDNFDKTTLQCYSRYRQINPVLNKGKWNCDEDELLRSYVKQYGKKWAYISKHMKNRSGKQIRDRYINCLDEQNLKHGFTEKEDCKIISLYKIYGPKWSIISKEFYGRTGDAIKNRYYWSIKPSLLSKNERLESTTKGYIPIDSENAKEDIKKQKMIFLAQKATPTTNKESDSTEFSFNNMNLCNNANFSNETGNFLIKSLEYFLSNEKYLKNILNDNFDYLKDGLLHESTFINLFKFKL